MLRGPRPARGRAGQAAEGAAPTAVPTRALAPRRTALRGAARRRSALSRAAARTHIPSIPGERGGGGGGGRAGTRRLRGGQRRARPGRGAQGGGLGSPFSLEAAVRKQLVPALCP